MQNKHTAEFERWWSRYEQDASRSPKRIARAAWNAAGHLLARLAREEGRKQAAAAEHKARQMAALLNVARSEIDTLEDRLRAAGGQPL